MQVPFTQIGFYGKLPIVGDFVQRSLQEPFISRWDQWLQYGLLEAQQRLGEQWLDYYLTCPVIRFALCPQVIDQQVWLGVLMCSVDKVGRCFPFTVAAAFDQVAVINCLYGGQSDFFNQLEMIALSGLDESNQLLSLEEALESVAFPKLVSSDNNNQESHLILSLTMSQSEVIEVGNAVLSLNHEHSLFSGCSFWLNPGSEHIGSALMCYQGLPTAQDFSQIIKCE